ncbi:MerR family transcriptional regulator [Nocardioides sp. Kera G14]|uniref:MerR family transcriptional regulator n=1 Tax=Nocardioides sp. Kera G14 TaxID=2884264 RepID=UPI001D1277A1|nr:MerR family transcriptional regulator [Nocardioides sp. Kera G14]UDY24794.1 MerR family transcriptional regulator [Nocardioides sp. Kera G14]
MGLTIGEFAALTHLSVRTLRRYHETGLLEPVAVDPSSGYRLYDATQIPAAQVIHRLRELDLPLAEVKAVLATSDPSRRASLVAAHLDRLESQLDRTRQAVVSLQRLLSPEAAPLDVVLRADPPLEVAAVRGEVTLDESGRWYDDAMAELDAAVPSAERSGPAGGHYANELFSEGRGEMLVFHPLGPAVAARGGGRVEVVVLPPAELAVTVHSGNHDDIGVTYGQLGEWVTTHALTVAGPVHERYLVGPRDGAPEAEWLTEIGWPIFRLSASPDD